MRPPEEFNFDQDEFVSGEFGSIREFAHWVERAAGLRLGKFWDNDSHANRGDVWAEYSYIDTLERAKNGGKLDDHRAAAVPFDIGLPIAEEGSALVSRVDMIGEEFDVDLYRQHDVECMHGLTFEPVEDRVVRIGIQTINPGGATATNIMNRCRAVLGVVDWLEMHGYSCEITALMINVISRNGSADRPNVDCRIVVKHAGEAWSPEQVAFAFHAGFYRRLGFRLQECFRKLEHPGYGYGSETGGDSGAAKTKERLGFDIYLPYMDTYDWTSETSSVRKVLAALKGANLDSAWVNRALEGK